MYHQEFIILTLGTTLSHMHNFSFSLPSCSALALLGRCLTDPDRIEACNVTRHIKSSLLGFPSIHDIYDVINSNTVMIRYSAIIALTGLPIRYSVIVALNYTASFLHGPALMM